jgi:hypothetical protein
MLIYPQGLRSPVKVPPTSRKIKSYRLGVFTNVSYRHHGVLSAAEKTLYISYVDGG